MGFFDFLGPVAEVVEPIFGAAGGAGATQGFNALFGRLSAKQQSQQWQSDQKWYMTNATPYAVQGLRAAGLNPALAIQRGGGIAAAPGTAPKMDAPPGQFTGAMESIGNIMSQFAGIETAATQQQLNKASSAAQMATAAKSLAEADYANKRTTRQSISGRVVDEIGDAMKKLLPVFTSEKSSATQQALPSYESFLSREAAKELRREERIRKAESAPGAKTIHFPKNGKPYYLQDGRKYYVE